MVIRRGEPWGEAVPSPPDLHLAGSDAEASAWVALHLQRGEPVPSFGVAAGDLARTMGGGTPERFPGTVTQAPVDVLRVDAGGGTTWAVAHVVARGRAWRGEARWAMNAQYIGSLDLAPRSHPNDGRMDVLVMSAQMPWRARLVARRRARTGTHLPHPDLATTQTATATWALPGRSSLWVDGVRWLTAPANGLDVVITVVPDALTVIA